ncbi:MAG: J domain-containing protein [Candidatus Heimdallarchaeota archaeon]|nr:J domain-containing protein [Candidatus Heimdallarchaeota archaeon]
MNRLQEIGSPEQIAAAVIILGVTPSWLSRIYRAADYKHARSELRRLQGRARNNYRKAAKKLHPDLNKGSDLKSDLFRVVNEVNDRIQTAAVKRRPIILADWKIR